VDVSINIARAGRKLHNDCVLTQRFISMILLASAASVGLAACGGSSSSSPPAASPSAAPPATSSATSGSSAISADQKAITTNWTAFFNPKTSVSKRVSLLQDGSQFTSIISSQAGSSLAAEASAQVNKVTVITSSEAEVVYTILVAGTPELKNQTGDAVFQDGTWKVGVGSFCGLLTLENGGSSKSLPAACKSAT
jgi:hypothetical protein